MEKTMAQYAEEELVCDMTTDGKFRPKVMLIADGTYMHFDYSPDKDGDLEKMRGIILKMILMHRLAGTYQRCCFMGEAWVSTVPVGEQRKYATCEEDPNRKDMAFFLAFEKDLTKTFKAWEVTKDAAGKVTLKPYAGLRPDAFESWIDKAFVNFGTPPAHLVETAKRMVENLRDRK